nr:unnamed protein product [Callosobruchus analis]
MYPLELHLRHDKTTERKDPIISAVALLQYNEWILTSKDWDILKICVDVLKIFDDVTQEISAKKTVTLSKAVYLNPRFKKLGLTSDSKSVWALETLKKKVTSIHTVEENVEEERVDAEDYNNNQTTSTLWEDFDATVVNVKGGTNPLTAGIVEVDKYMNEPMAGRNENPLIWWKQRKAIDPRLYTLA